MVMRTIIGKATIAGIAAVALLFWYFDLGHDSVEKLPRLHGKSLDAAIAELGEPDRQDEYAMAECPGDEFRVELYNTYPPGDPKAAHVRIKELQWDRARYHIAIWLHQVDGEWRVLDTCRWKEGVVF
jgi:hypothetical protein